MIDFDFSAFEEMHYDNGGEKFKIGQMVRYIGNPCQPQKYEYFKEYVGKEFEVRAVNRCDEDSVEYLLGGFPYLVWEEEIELVVK